jgi:Sec-independent protein translocase protein TatA
MEPTTEADVIMRLLDKIEEQRKTIRALKEYESEETNQSETEDQEKKNEEQTESLDPLDVRKDKRSDRIVEYFKEHGTGHMATIPELAKEVFDSRVKDSSDEQYIAITNTLSDDPRLTSTKKKKGRYTQYKLNPRLKRD